MIEQKLERKAEAEKAKAEKTTSLPAEKAPVAQPPLEDPNNMQTVPMDMSPLVNTFFDPKVESTPPPTVLDDEDDADTLNARTRRLDSFAECPKDDEPNPGPTEALGVSEADAPELRPCDLSSVFDAEAMTEKEKMKKSCVPTPTKTQDLRSHNLDPFWIHIFDGCHLSPLTGESRPYGSAGLEESQRCGSQKQGQGPGVGAHCPQEETKRQGKDRKDRKDGKDGTGQGQEHQHQLRDLINREI